MNEGDRAPTILQPLMNDMIQQNILRAYVRQSYEVDFLLTSILQVTYRH